MKAFTEKFVMIIASLVAVAGGVVVFLMIRDLAEPIAFLYATGSPATLPKFGMLVLWMLMDFPLSWLVIVYSVFVAWVIAKATDAYGAIRNAIGIFGLFLVLCFALLSLLKADTYLFNRHIRKGGVSDPKKNLKQIVAPNPTPNPSKDNPKLEKQDSDKDPSLPEATTRRSKAPTTNESE